MQSCSYYSWAMEGICLLWLFWVFRHSNYHIATLVYLYNSQYRSQEEKKKRQIVDCCEKYPAFYPHIFPRSQSLGIHFWNVKLYQRKKNAATSPRGKNTSLFCQLNYF